MTAMRGGSDSAPSPSSNLSLIGLVQDPSVPTTGMVSNALNTERKANFCGEGFDGARRPLTKGGDLGYIRHRAWGPPQSSRGPVQAPIEGLSTQPMWLSNTNNH